MDITIIFQLGQLQIEIGNIEEGVIGNIPAIMVAHSTNTVA